MKALRKIGILAAAAAAVIGITGCQNNAGAGGTPDSKKPDSPSQSTVPKDFVKVPGASIKGTESWTPYSYVFVGDRALEIKSFYMSDHEVTRAEYKDVMESLPDNMAKAHDKDGNELTGDKVGKNPVNKVSWYDAIVYCNKRSIKEKLTPCYTIGGKTNPDEWGAVPSSEDSTWNAAACDFNANGYGLYDMSGNVYEWCWDWYGNVTSATPPAGPSSGSDRRNCGGSWYNFASNAKVSNRSFRTPHLRAYPNGFRVVRSTN